MRVDWLTPRSGAIEPETQRRCVATAAVYAGIAALFVLVLTLPDLSLQWAASDEVCCHTPTIRAIRDEGLSAALRDSARYRSATTPLYHLVMSVVLDRVDPLAIRCGWIVVALIGGFLVYTWLCHDQALSQKRRAALAITLAFMLSPTVRASALYFVTDGLAVHLAVAALVLLQYSTNGQSAYRMSGIGALVLAFASFYTRQYYAWVTFYVAYTVFRNSDRRLKLVTAIACAVLTVPALLIFSIWHGVTPPLGTPIHNTPLLLSTVPNAMGLLAIYAVPLVYIAARDTVRRRSDITGRRVLLAVGAILCGGALYAALWSVFGFAMPQEGGILRMLSRLGRFGDMALLLISYVGVAMLARWVLVDGASQLWWGVFLAPLLGASFLLQRYVDPIVLVFMFFVARPRDALQVLDSRLVWFYPAFSIVYSLTRALYFTTL